MRPETGVLEGLDEIDGTNLIPELVGSMSHNQPSLLLLADRRSDAESLTSSTQPSGTFEERVEADDHGASTESLDDGGNYYKISGTEFNGLSHRETRSATELQVDGQLSDGRASLTNANRDVRDACTDNSGTSVVSPALILFQNGFMCLTDAVMVKINL